MRKKIIIPQQDLKSEATYYLLPGKREKIAFGKTGINHSYIDRMIMQRKTLSKNSYFQSPGKSLKSAFAPIQLMITTTIQPITLIHTGCL